MSGALSTYGFLNAKLKARISGILSEGKIEELVRAKSLPEAMILLKGTAFEPLEASYTRTGDLRGGESLLYTMEIELYTGLLRYAKEPIASLFTSLAARYEVDTLKTAIRLWFDSRVRGRDIEDGSVYLYRGTILHTLDLDAILAATNADELARALEGTPYQAVVRDYGPKAETEKTLFPLETALDRQYYGALIDSFSALSPRDREIAVRVLGVEIDMYNIEWLIRAQSFYRLSMEEALAALIPNGMAFEPSQIAAAYNAGNISDLLSELLKKKYGRFQVLLGKGVEQSSRLAFMERLLRQILLAEAERLLSGYPFTIGVALAYFALKRQEIRTVLTILNAKYYLLPEERIRSTL